MKFGIFDSGIGGLSLVRALLERDFLDFIYLKDTNRFPYGTREKNDLIAIGKNNIEFLIDKGAEEIIIACHTLSNAGAEELRAQFPNVRIHDVLGPTLRSLNKNSYQKLMLLGTNTTVNLGMYRNNLPRIAFTELPSSDLAQAIEDEDTPQIHTIIANRIAEGAKKNPDNQAILLACTHFSLIKDLFDQHTRLPIIDPITLLIDELDTSVNNNKKGLSEHETKYYQTIGENLHQRFDPKSQHLAKKNRRTNKKQK